MDIEDRMKGYELAEAGRCLMPMLPTLARVDGRCFHAFTKCMNRPFDAGFSQMMILTTRYLVKETNATMGYTQSDEITLAWHSEMHKSKIWFDGRVCKMISQVAAHATLAFYRLVLERMPERADMLPTFDARVWQVPNRTEGANVFVWREQDATRNSISMAAQSVFSAKQLHGKDSSEMQEMLFSKGINWNDYASHFKRGTYIQRKKVARPFTLAEIDSLPEKHEARTNPNLVVERSDISEIAMPPFTSVRNRDDVIFKGDAPLSWLEPNPTSRWQSKSAK